MGYGRFENDTVRFDNVQGAVVFRMVIYRDGRMISLGEPFELNKQSGALRFFRASDVRQKAVFLQKFKEDFQAHMVGGVFEADNRADFRNRDNFIRKGDCYELFYATAGGWTSLGKQVAVSDSLAYDVPKGALLYLRDHTRGVDDRIFEMVDGKQKLW